MASAQCFKNTEKGLNPGYYGGGSSGQNANWGCKATRKENKYQGPQNGYAMAYSESECYSEIQYPNHGKSKSQTAYRKAETWDEYGRSYGSHKSQNGNAMFKTPGHGRGNGFGNHSSNGTSQLQAYGSSNQTGPGNRQGHGYGYGGSTPGNQKNSGGMGHGFSNHTNYEMTEAYVCDEINGGGKYTNNGMADSHSHPGGKHSGQGHGFNNHTNYEITEAYGCEETNGSGKYTNNGLTHSQAPLRGKHSVQGNGFMKTQAYGPGKNMGYEISEMETGEYGETYYSNESHCYGGGSGYRAGKGENSVKGLLRKIKDGFSANKSCSDSESGTDNDNDNDNDDDYGMRKVWISKAI